MQLVYKHLKKLFWELPDFLDDFIDDNILYNGVKF